MASSLPAAADTFRLHHTGAGQTELDRLFESYVAMQNMLVGLTAAVADLNQLTGLQAPLVAKLPLGHADTGGGVLAWAAPADCFVAPLVIDVTHIATAACTLDAGGTAVSATTLADNLIDGVDVHAATGSFDNRINAGANGLAMVRIARGKWVTISTASGAAAGLAGFAFVHYVLA